MVPGFEDCPICTEPMGLGTGRATTRAYQCSHAFCAPCVRKWAWRGDTCPLCRAERYYNPAVARLRRRAHGALNAYLKVSALVFLFHACVMLSGHTVTITYAADSGFRNITLECPSFKTCVRSHVAFVLHGYLK